MLCIDYRKQSERVEGYQSHAYNSLNEFHTKILLVEKLASHFAYANCRDKDVDLGNDGLAQKSKEIGNYFFQNIKSKTYETKIIMKKALFCPCFCVQCLLLLLFFFGVPLIAAPPEGTFIVEIHVAHIREWAAQNSITTSHLIEEKNEPESTQLLSRLFQAEKVQGSMELGFLTGRPTRLIGQIKFARNEDAEEFLNCVSNSPSSSQKKEFLLIKSIDGLPPLFARRLSEKSITLCTEELINGDRKSILSMSESAAWKQSAESAVRVAINIGGIRNVLNQIILASVPGVEFQAELSSCVENCEKLVIAVDPAGAELVKVVAIAASEDNAIKLRSRIDGLLFLLRTTCRSFLEQNSTGHEDVDDALLETVAEPIPHQNKFEVSISILRSKSVDLVLGRIIELVNASISNKDESSKTRQVSPLDTTK